MAHDGAEHGIHCEGWEHDGVAVEEDGVVAEADEARDVEEGHDGEDFVARARGDELELAQLVALGDDVVVGEHDGFGEAGGAGAEVEVAAYFFVCLVGGDGVWGGGGVLGAEGDEVGEGGEGGAVAGEQEDVAGGEADGLSCCDGDVEGAGEGEEEFRAGGLQRVRHFLRVIRGRCSIDSTSGSDGSPHSHGVPDSVGREQGHGVAGLEAIFADQSGAEVSRFLLDFGEIKALLRSGVDVAALVVSLGV